MRDYTGGLLYVLSERNACVLNKTISGIISGIKEEGVVRGANLTKNQSFP